MKEMELGAEEFIRRFEQHISASKYFTKIRSYG
ncbi:MAG: transposase [Saprospiraceae bacterium]|nr:transposase [Saprospiraceae bacterium]